MALLINEIFYSIQGESTWSGLPCGFVRLSQCNLRCRYCDTIYAYEGGDFMEIKDVLKRLRPYHCAHVTITGGEPLLQKETPALVKDLIQNGFNVSMETNGSLDIGLVDDRCIKVMDLKCPSSGMQAYNRTENLMRLGPLDQVKFVISNATDFEFAHQEADRLSGAVQADRILFSPVHGLLPSSDLARWMLDAHTHGRLQIQLHKYLWPEIDRGV
jgi:7-carboxy-7-deazaguanine synthase